MKVTIENYQRCGENPKLLYSLLIDLAELNELIEKYKIDNKQLYIDYQDYHDSYSAERTDPCPDYYGMYRVWRGDDFIGVEMDLDTLDSTLCLLYNFVIEDD